MRCAAVCLLVVACGESEPTFVDGHVSLDLTSDDPAQAMFTQLRIYAHRQTHYPDPPELVSGVDLRLEIDGAEMPADTLPTVLPTLRGYPGELAVLADDERDPVPLVPFFTARVEMTEIVYRVTFDPPIQRGEQAALERMSYSDDNGYEVIDLPVGATMAEAQRAETYHLRLYRSAHSSYDAEGLRVRGHMFVSRTLVGY